MIPPSPRDHEIAADLATNAGEVLLDLRERLSAEGRSSEDLKSEGDKRSNDYLLERLQDLVPEDAVLSEESTDDKERLRQDRVWIIDPLDGTREFGEVPRDDWAVHVALAIKGTAAAGAVALPAQGMTLATEPAARLAPPAEGAPRLIVSRTRPPKIARDLAQALGGHLFKMGSAGAKAMAVVQGNADIYAHSGGQYEWDSAAPAAVALGAGCHVSRLDGSPLVYNNDNPYLPDLLICRPELGDQVLAIIDKLGVK